MTSTRPRLIVLTIAEVVTACKLDVHSWLSVSEGVRRFGPVDMYGHQYFSLYNHPPLSGRMLVAINWLVDHQIGSFTFLVKVPAVLADRVIAMLVFELVRLRRPAAEAAVAGAGKLVTRAVRGIDTWLVRRPRRWSPTSSSCDSPHTRRTALSSTEHRTDPRHGVRRLPVTPATWAFLFFALTSAAVGQVILKHGMTVAKEVPSGPTRHSS